MATQETLKINITADNKQAIAEFTAMNNTLRKFENALKSATDPGQVQFLQRNITFLKDKIDTASKSMGNAADVVKRSKGSYVELSRVIQDLPFGFTAISNNLTQLIPGVGALGLAFSGLVAALTFSQVGFTAWGASTKKAKEEANKLNESIAEEITKLKVLYQVATNANAPLEARKEAIKDLRSQYGNYLKNVSDEEIATGKATVAYNNLAAAIVKVAKAKAAQDKITELTAKRLEEESKIVKLREEAEKSASSAAIKAGGQNVGGFQKFTDAATVQADRLAFLRGEANKVRDAIAGIDKEIGILTQTIDQNTVKPLADGLSKVATELKKIKDLGPEVRFLGNLGQGLVAPVQRQQRPEAIQRELGENPLQPIIDAERKQLAANEALNLYISFANEALAITNLFASSLNDLGNALLQGQGFGEALGNVFRKLAADIAAAAIKALIFKSVLGALTGGTSSLLGGLVGKSTGFGDLFKGFLGLAPKPFADGGVVNKPTLGVFGEAGSEAIMPLNKLNSMLMTASQLGGGNMSNMEIMTKVSGQDLLLWIQRAGYSRNLQR